MAYFLALDAGATKTDFALADETCVLTRVRVGTLKRMRADAQTAAANLEAALRQLTTQTGISMGAIKRTCIGTAGNTVPLVTDWLCEAFGARVGGSLFLLGDVEIALDAAFPGQPGVLVLAGTGSNLAGRAPDGTLHTAGGWGPALADQGSGHRIGQQALRAICAAEDAGRPTTLKAAVLAFWQLASFYQLVEHANVMPPPDFSKLTHIVAGCALAGDALAEEVLRGQGEELSAVVSTLIWRLREHSGDPSFLPPLAFAGSIMEKVSLVRDTLTETLSREFNGIMALPGVVDPIDGALWRARTGTGFTE